NGVTKKFGEIAALRDVNLNVRAGELLAVLGPNGAGKTTAVRLMLGLTTPGSGQVTVLGKDPRQARARSRIGAMLQVAKVPETLKVREHINLFRSYYNAPLSLPATLEAAGLEGMEERLFGALSGGQKQRVLFALAICGDPELLFLDEPTVGLDITTRHLIWQQIRRLVQRGRTVVLTTHYLEEVDALADRVVVLNHGTIVAEGTATEIKSRTAQRKIRCYTRLRLTELEAIPEVSSVSEQGINAQRTQIEIRTAQVEPVLRELFLRDPQLTGLEVSNSTLEEAFLKIVETGNQELHQEATA
ncbi:MAG TPA: ABC transporter ATP-binding protein, partial [Candidatus Angelobacter sp.]|nr:ABC transporter ATP-binding protein [Candidatus Angelobacter sp.]